MASRIKHRLLLLVALMGGLALMFAQPAAAYSPTFKALEPGATKTYELKVPVNIVMVGVDKGQFSESDLRGLLPPSYKPVPRVPKFYDDNFGTSYARDLGLNFKFDYAFKYTSDDFEDDFFSYLKQIGEEGPPTIYQQCYSGTAPPVEGQPNACNQVGAKETIDEDVLYIDGPKVEKWLSKNAPSDVGLKTNAYTVYFVNWYGRDDFKFHVYTRTDAADPDTGVNFGKSYPDFTALIAWGGTHSRSWFYDFSAGPEYNTTNWEINDPDLDGDGVEEYRMPPIWEYAKGGYRSPSKLGYDMGLLVRYVAINLLFTSSPLYDPLVTTPGREGRKVVSIDVLQQDPDADGTDYVDKGYIRRELRSFEPYYSWKVDVNETDPIDTGADRALRIYAGLTEPTAEDCATNFGTANAELFCYFDANLDKYIPAYEEDNYVGEVFAFNITDAIDDKLGGLLGFADDDWKTGTQSYIFAFDAPGTRDAGYGFSKTTVHEFGHHLGLSHPHDGYDPPTNTEYGPGGPFYFVWVGDESDTIMHYLVLANGFGKFDRDNMYRYETAGYLNASNALLEQILASPNASKVDDEIEDADGYARSAERSFQSWSFLSSARSAYKAYNKLRAAAEELGIDATAAQTNAARLPWPAKPHMVDRPRPFK